MKKRKKEFEPSSATQREPSEDNNVDVEMRRLLEQDIQQGLDVMERWAPPKQPSHAWFVAMAASQQKAAKAKLYRELAIFLSCALAIVGGLMATLATDVSLYLVLQPALTLLVSVPLLWRRGDREDRWDG